MNNNNEKTNNNEPDLTKRYKFSHRILLVNLMHRIDIYYK